MEPSGMVTEKVAMTTDCKDHLTNILQTGMEPKTPDSDRSSQRSPETSNNHAAETRDDHVGRSHVDCEDDEGGSEREEEYWRPRYMFHWLKAAGWQVKDAYKAFETYKGKASYDQLQLKPPEPKQTEDGETDESSHMSDYDEMGLTPISAENVHCEEEQPSTNDPQAGRDTISKGINEDETWEHSLATTRSNISSARLERQWR